MNKTIPFLFLLSSTLAGAASDLPKGLSLAHEAYLACDSHSLLDNVKQALIESNNHPLVIENTTRLMKAAKKNGCFTQVNGAFKLPAEISYLEFEVQRKYRTDSGKVTFVFNGALGYNKGEDLETFQVIRYPDQVVLDLEAKVGEIFPDTSNPNKDELWMASEQTTKPVEEGLFLVNMKLKGRALVKTFFILADKNSSASPIVMSPETNQVVTGSRPTFEFKNFHSPEFNPKEGTRANVSVRDPDSEADDLIWVRLNNPLSTFFKVGDKSTTRDYRGISDLPSGKYVMQYTIREVEYFGDIALKRASTTRVPFTIK